MYRVRFVLAVAVCIATMTPKVMADEPSQAVRSALPELPKGTILAAHFVRDGKWHPLGSDQIASVCRVLAGAPYSPSHPGMRIQFPPLGHRIILWTKGEQGLVPEDVVDCHDDMNFLYSAKNGKIYGLNGSMEQKELLKLVVAAIEDEGTSLNTSIPKKLDQHPTASSLRRGKRDITD